MLVFYCRIFIILLLVTLTFSCSSPTSDGNHETKTENLNSEIVHEHSHEAADPHMRMTALREPNTQDEQRAAAIAEKARRAIERYKDYKIALGDGFEILLPDVPQK